MASNSTHLYPITLEAFHAKKPKAPLAHSIPKCSLPPFPNSQSGDSLYEGKASLKLSTVTIDSDETRGTPSCSALIDVTLLCQKLEQFGDKVPHAECVCAVSVPTVEWVETVVSPTNSSRSFGGSDSVLVDEGDPITDTSHLRVPLNDKLWLVSPPGSPPIGWTSTLEHPPHDKAFPDDLLDALTEWEANSFGGLDKKFTSTPSIPSTTFAFSNNCGQFKGEGGEDYPLIVVEDWSV